MELINCKIRVPKVNQVGVESIERLVNGDYLIKLKEGYSFNWGDISANESSQKEVLETLKSVVEIVKENVEISENAEVSTSNIVAFKKEPIIEEPTRNEGEILHAFLVDGIKVSMLAEKFGYEYVASVLDKFSLESGNCGDFEGCRKGIIFGTLRRHSRFDIISILEEKYYGFTSSESQKKANISNSKYGVHAYHFDARNV